MTKKIINIVLVLIIVCLAYFSGVYIGAGNNAKGVNIINRALNQPENLDFSLFWQVWDTLQKKHIGGADERKMFYGGISGMVQSLGDPYSAFMDPEQTKQFQSDMSGQFEGIGAEIGLRKDHLTIVAPLDGSPAKKAGLLAGDILISINDQSTTGLTVEQAVDLIRGKKGTVVTINVLRNNKPLEFKITRDIIQVNSVTWKVEKDSIGYIKLSRFGDDTLELLNNAATDLNKQTLKGLILDLRNNPGGYLDVGVSVANAFLPKDTLVVTEKDKDGKEDIFKTTKAALFDTKIPLIILVDGGSASASEIVAGAIKDNSRGKLLGEKTYGKGSVQQVESFSDGSSLRVTIAHWYTPKGKNISKEGIDPDVIVAMTDADYQAGRDPQLSKALELLTK